MSDDLLTVTDLSVTYGHGKKQHHAVSDVSFAIGQGETLALVGESGSGKSTIGNAILGLVPIGSGSVVLDGTELTTLSVRGRRAMSHQLQAIFQNPYGSLNPALTIGDILAEPLQVGGSLSKRNSRSVIGELLERVGLPADSIDRYPGHFSGGQRQRIAIARAVAVRPKLIVCDEPTSALDVSTQKTVLELLSELQRDTGVSYLFVTHDLAVVRHFADRVIVLQRGRLVETGTPDQICENPHEEYTQRLVAAAPVPDPVLQRRRREARAAALASTV